MRHGNARLLARVFADSPSAGTSLLVALAIAETTESDGWSRASIATLATRARVKERQVQRTVAELATRGEIEVINRSGGRGRVSSYRIAPERVSPMTPFRDRKGVTEDTLYDAERVTSTTPFDPGKGVVDDSVSRKQPGKGVPDDTVSFRAGAGRGKPRKKQQHHLHPQAEAVGKVLRLFRDRDLLFAPKPSQVGQWLKTIGHERLSDLLELIEEQIGNGLEGRERPLAYLWACVQSLAAGTYRRVPRQNGLPLGAGSDDERISQAASLMGGDR